MKLATITNNVETNVVGSEMKILQSAKMFEMLAGLYSDVPKAIWRELIANAHDASPTRMTIALPSVVNPFISIRDYGAGMSHEFMTGGYTWVGHSTKTDNNNSIGAFGLGRIVPIAYKGANAYTVISIHEGVRRSYAVFKNEKGVPVVALTHEEPTDEPSGCEIQVPILKADYGLFEAKLKDVLRWFPEDCYEVFGTRVEPIPRLLATDTYIQTNDLGRNYVLMGPIAYEIDWSHIGVQLPQTFVPIFKIGELDLPPNRESVAYSPMTLEVLRRRYVEVSATLVPHVLQKFEDATTWLERIKLKEGLWGLKDLFETYHKAQGHRAADEKAREQFYAKNKTYVGAPKKVWGQFAKLEHEEWVLNTNATIYSRAGYRSSRSLDKSPTYRSQLTFGAAADFTDRTFVLMDVTDKNPRTYARLENRKLQAPVVVISDPVVFDKIAKEVPAGKVFKLSELPPPPTEKARSRMLHYVSYANEYGFTQEAGELPEEGVWAPFEGKDLEDRYYKFVRHPWARPITVYGFHRTAQKKVDLDDFERIDDYLRRRAKEWLAHPDLTRAYSAQQTLAQIQKHPFWGVRHLLGDVSERIERLRAEEKLIPAEVLEGLTSCASYGWFEMPKVRDYHRLQAALDRALKRNPTLKVMLDLAERRVWFTDPEIQEQLKKVTRQ